jgi:hypothetical protein
MKRIDTSQVADPARQPFLAGSLEFLQDATKEVIDALVKSQITYVTNDIIIIYGCVLTGTDPGVRDLTAGAIYYNGEIYLVSAQSITTTGSNIPVWVRDLVTYDTGIDPVTFSDGIAHSVHQVRKFKIQEGPIGGSGITNYVADYDSATIKPFKHEWVYNSAFATTITSASVGATISASSFQAKRIDDMVFVTGFVEVTYATTGDNDVIFITPLIYPPATSNNAIGLVSSFNTDTNSEGFAGTAVETSNTIELGCKTDGFVSTDVFRHYFQLQYRVS